MLQLPTSWCVHPDPKRSVLASGALTGSAQCLLSLPSTHERGVICQSSGESFWLQRWPGWSTSLVVAARSSLKAWSSSSGGCGRGGFCWPCWCTSLACTPRSTGCCSASRCRVVRLAPGEGRNWSSTSDTGGARCRRAAASSAPAMGKSRRGIHMGSEGQRRCLGEPVRHGLGGDDLSGSGHAGPVGVAGTFALVPTAAMNVTRAAVLRALQLDRSKSTILLRPRRTGAVTHLLSRQQHPVARRRLSRRRLGDRRLCR